jgi:hypothetical protein
MPKNEVDPTDPMELKGIGFPVSDESSLYEMAESFVHEFYRIGYPPEKQLEIFRDPFYAAAHGAYQDLGEEYISKLVHDFAPLFGYKKNSEINSTLDQGEEHA